MTVFKRPQAEDDLWAMAHHFARRVNRQLAIRFLDAAEKTANDLGSMPRLGAICPYQKAGWPQIRYFRIRGFPKHFLFYHELPQIGIVLLRVIHGYRNIPRVIRLT